MKLFKRIIGIIILIMLFSGCSIKEVNISPKIEVISYKEEIIKNYKPETLDFICDYSDFEIYSWGKDDVKFEITKRLRGTREKDVLENEFKNFSVNISQVGGKLNFKSYYKGKINNPIDRSLDLKIYVPKKIQGISFKLDSGNINFLDDVDYNLRFDANMTDTSINRLNGAIDFKSKVGNIDIKNGRIKGNSNIKAGIGNINIKAEFEDEGKYNFLTDVGNIYLNLPQKAQVNFETIGTLEVNELQTYSNNTIIKLKTGMGKITIKKY